MTTATADAIETWSDADRALLQLASAEGNIERIKQRYEKRMRDARAALKDETEQDKEIAQTLREQLASFMLDHEADLDAGKRSIRLEHGTLSLRRTPAKLVTLSRVTWQRVLDVALTLPKKLRESIVETSHALRKAELKAMLQSDELKDEHRKALGVRLEQTDEVYYELA